MSKAKVFGGVGILAGVAIMVAVKLGLNYMGKSFMRFILETFLPTVGVTVALIAIVIGILLLVYG